MNARQVQRLENKKRKMDALNEIKLLNEADRRIKKPYSIINLKPVAKKKSKLMLYLKHQGESAQINDTGLPQSRIPLFVSDVRDFLLYIVFNKTCPPYTEPRWCNISKKKIDHTILLVVEGFTLNDYLKNSHQMTCLRDGFVKMEIVPPSSYSMSLIHELIMSSKHEESQDISPSANKPAQSPTDKTSLDSLATVHTVKSAFPICNNQNRASANTTTLPSKTSSSARVVDRNLLETNPLESTKNLLSGVESNLESLSSSPGVDSNLELTRNSSAGSGESNLKLTRNSSSGLESNLESLSSSPGVESNLESTRISLSGAEESIRNSLSGAEKSIKTLSSGMAKSTYENDKFPRTMLLLSALQMIEEDYPIPLRGELSARFSKYINTKDIYSEVTPQSPLFGLDCEMCKTANDRNELTRVTLVDEHENVIYESLVKPYNTITNYLTPYSGITRALLAPVATRLEDAQRALIEHLPSDAILVGQSLNCDLHALKMMHPYVIDTSVIFNTTGIRSHKPKLKTLASHFLDMEIQNNADGTVGHCSKEDAIAALRLVRLKLSKDPQFGDTVALQKCIRNINSKLSCPGEVRNLWAYFDKIVTKKKDAKVEKTALVLTTDKEAELEYKKYLATYRTKCKLIVGNNNIITALSSGNENNNTNNNTTPSSGNENQPESKNANEKSTWNTSNVLEPAVETKAHNESSKTFSKQCKTNNTTNKLLKNQSNAVNKPFKMDNTAKNQSNIDQIQSKTDNTANDLLKNQSNSDSKSSRTDNNDLINESLKTIDKINNEDSNRNKQTNSNQTKNNCKRKIICSASNLNNKLSNNTTSIPSLVDLDEPNSPPSKLKKDTRELKKCKSGDRGNLTNNTKVTNKPNNTHTKEDTHNVKDLGEKVKSNVEYTKVENSGKEENSTHGNNNIKDLVENVNSNVIELDEIDGNDEYIDNTFNKSKNNTSEELMIVEEISDNDNMKSFDNCKQESSEEDSEVDASKKSYSEFRNKHSMRQDSAFNNLKSQNPPDNTVKNSQTTNETLAKYAAENKQLVREILDVSSQKELVIGHTKVSDRLLLNTMVEELENGLTENQLLVILSVPENEHDKSSGVCFVYASSC